MHLEVDLATSPGGIIWRPIFSVFYLSEQFLGKWQNTIFLNLVTSDFNPKLFNPMTTNDLYKCNFLTTPRALCGQPRLYTSYVRQSLIKFEMVCYISQCMKDVLCPADSSPSKVSNGPKNEAKKGISQSVMTRQRFDLGEEYI